MKEDVNHLFSKHLEKSFSEKAKGLKSTLSIELKKMKEISSEQLISSSFLFGYLSAVITSTRNRSNWKRLEAKIRSISSLVSEKTISYDNYLEIFCIARCKAAEGKNQIEPILILIDELISEATVDQKSLQKKYFYEGSELKNFVAIEVKNPEVYKSYSKLQKKLEEKEEKMQEKSSFIPSFLGKVESDGGLGMECPICLVDIKHKELCLLSCGHSFHHECFRIYAQNQIQQKKIPLSCPQDECTRKIETRDIEEELNGDILEKFYTFSLQTYVQKNQKDTAWCPTAGCGNVFEFDPLVKQFNCSSCHRHYCLQCRCEMHVGISCEENKQMMPEDKEFVNFAKGASFKQCPNCKFWVEKNEGCDHMTCRCEYEFCYKCGGQYGTCSCEEEDDGPNDEEEDRHSYYS